MSSIPARAVPSPLRAAAGRGLAFFLLWLLLMQSAKPADLALGLLTATGATWLSLQLLPPVSGSLRFGQFALMLPRFIWISVLAGFDVARRAMHPRLPLHPGLVDCPVGLPPGLARNTFASITSLMPGTVPVSESERTLTYHCLDTTQPVLEQLSAEERLLGKAVIAGQRHD